MLWAYRNSWTLDTRIWTLHATLWTLGSGHWTLSLTVSEQNQNSVSDSAWLNYWKLIRCKSLRTSWSRLLWRDKNRFWRAFFRNSILKLCVTSQNNTKRNFYCEKFELHYKQLSWAVQKQSSTAFLVRKFFQKILVVESLIWTNYRLTIQSSDYILNWLHHVFLDVFRKLSERLNIIDCKYLR